MEARVSVWFPLTIVEWIFVLNEGDPEVPSGRMGRCAWLSCASCGRSPFPVPTRRHHPIALIEDLREERFLSLVPSFSQ